MTSRLTRRQFIVSASAVVAVLALPRWAFAEDDPIAFAQSLYALPSLWSDVTADDEAIDKYLDANLGALIRENYAKTDFESALDYDPLVQAQDFEQVKTSFKVVSQTDAAAVIEVSVSNLGEDTAVRLDLTNTADGWRLSDVHADAEVPSLVDELKELNAATGSEEDNSTDEPDGEDDDSGD